RRGGAQLLAQQAAQPLVDPQALGDVALSFERLHQNRVAAFSVWGDIDKAPAAAFRQGDLSSPDAEASPRRAFQGPDLDLLQLSAQLVDPGALLTRKKAALTDVVRDQGGADRRVPVTSGDQRLGAMDSIARRLDVYSRVASQLQPGRAAALEGADGEQSSQFR